MKKAPKMMPGMKRGVMMMLRRQASPPKVLYTRAETYPPIPPKRAEIKRMAVASNPRFEGERRPSKANAAQKC